MNEIEKNFTLLMNPSVIKTSLGKDDAISHLNQAKSLFENAGLKAEADQISSIIKKAIKIDDSDIEVKL